MTGVRVRLVFPPDLVRQPILGELVGRFAVLPNIRRADVRAETGWIVCELDGDADAVELALAWLDDIGVGTSRLDRPLES